MQKNALPAEGSIFHQRYNCHILNLIVQDGLAVLSDEIAKIYDTMKYLHHSQARMKMFQLVASQVNVLFLLIISISTLFISDEHLYFYLFIFRLMPQIKTCMGCFNTLEFNISYARASLIAQTSNR
jgi:hypothetical protein